MNIPATPRGPALAALTILSVPAAASAAPDCAQYPRMVAALEAEGGQLPAATGVAGTDAIVDFFVSPRTGAWTVTRTGPGGRTCIVIRGQGFQVPVPPGPPDGDPA